MSEGPSVQERYAPRNHGFGCGPAKAKGIREAEGKNTATCRGAFMAVGEDLPAYDRW